MTENTETEVLEQTSLEGATSENQEPEMELEQPSETETEASYEETNESEPPKDNAAWAAMRVENKRLKEQLSQQPQVDEEYLQEARNFANATGGYYQPQAFDESSDLEQVSRAINQANQVALEASSRTRQLEIQLEEERMFNQFPHFKEDKLAQQLIAEKKLVSKTLGRERSYTEIAREVDKLIRRDREQVEAQVRESERQSTAQKMAATTQTPSYTSTGIGDDRESLRMRARRGDVKAQAELMKPHLEGIDFNF